jgi:glycosyltransferase involved in cell wall biosynthesis
VRRPEGEILPGFTAVLRVRDEARSLPFVLPPLLRAVKHVVVVDNRSTDGTADVARRVAADEDAADRLEVKSYPFAVARCGPEHLATPAESVHSLAYFYNWSFSHVRTAYALKWDGDMVLADSAVAALRALVWQLEAVEAVIQIPRHPLYVVDDRSAFLDVEQRNYEPWGWPNRPEQRFVKAMEWEIPLWLPEIGVTLPERSCIELKHLDADEFAHWSGIDFDASFRTRRKQREYEVFNAIAGGSEPPAGIVRIDAPPGEHIVDYVRTSWLTTGSPALASVG